MGFVGFESIHNEAGRVQHIGGGNAESASSFRAC